MLQPAALLCRFEFLNGNLTIPQGNQHVDPRLLHTPRDERVAIRRLRRVGGPAGNLDTPDADRMELPVEPNAAVWRGPVAAHWHVLLKDGAVEAAAHPYSSAARPRCRQAFLPDVTGVEVICMVRSARALVFRSELDFA